MGITIDEAIRVLSDDQPITTRAQRTKYNAAVKLGIKALKRVKDWREGKVLNPDFKLPGETEEQPK